MRARLVGKVWTIPAAVLRHECGRSALWSAYKNVVLLGSVSSNLGNSAIGCWPIRDLLALVRSFDKLGRRLQSCKIKLLLAVAVLGSSGANPDTRSR